MSAYGAGKAVSVINNHMISNEPTNLHRKIQISDVHGIRKNTQQKQKLEILAIVMPKKTMNVRSSVYLP